MADINNPIKYSDLIKADSSIDELIKKLDEANSAYMNLANNVKQEAQRLGQSLNGVTGATESGRRAIKASSDEAVRLQKAYEGVDAALSENAKKIAELNAIKAEQNRINKLTIQMNNSAEGSYNRLSAEYSLLKIQINALSKEERENNAEAKAMVQRSKEVYEQMKQLQEATGKHQLNVGNYAEAAQGLRMELRNLTQQMAAMKLAGDDNSEEYRKMSERAGQLRDAMADATQEVSAMASDTSQLDTVMSGMTAASGGFTAAVGAMQMFGGESEEVQEAQKKLQAAMAITMGLTQVQTALQKQSALMLGVAKLQTMALAKAEAYERLIKIQGTKATIGATAAQKAFNIVAKANPYVILATALISVVGALLLFANGTEDAGEKQEKLNKLESQHIENLQRIDQLEVQIHDIRIKRLNAQLALAKASGASMEEQRAIEDKMMQEEERNQREREKRYARQIANIKTYRENIKTATETLKTLQERAAQDADAEVNIIIDGKKMEMKVEDAIARTQEYIDNQQQHLTIGLEVKESGTELEEKRRQQEAERRKEDAERAKAARKTELEEIRATEKAKIALITNTYDRQRAEADATARNEKTDLTNRLREQGLTAKARQAINTRLALIEQQHADAIRRINEEQMRAEEDAVKETESMRVALMQDSEGKELAELRQKYDARRDAIIDEMNKEGAHTLAEKVEMNKQLLLLDEQQEQDEQAVAERWNGIRYQSALEAVQMRIEATQEGSRQELDLRLQAIEMQREKELQENRNRIEDERQDEMDINAKYDAMILKQKADFHKKEIEGWASMMQSEIDLLNVSERKKEQISLELEAERLRKVIDLIRKGEIQATTEELTQYENQYQAAVQKADALAKFATHSSTREDLKAGLQEAANYTLETLNSITEARMQMAEAAVEEAQKEVDAAKEALAVEREAAANGYASNQELAQKELDMAKENQRKALAQQKKAQRQQAAVDTLSQISSLVTASASMWKDLGFPMALVGIATMWASFAASKIMAGKLAKQQGSEEYGEGTVELLQGGSHQSGNDIDLGAKKDGTRRRAEGGEFFAVINKRSSRRWRKEIPEVINALNDGTFGRKYLNAYDAQGGVVMNYAGADLTNIEGEVKRIREQGEERTYIDNGVVVTKYKNITRRTR